MKEKHLWEAAVFLCICGLNLQSQSVQAAGYKVLVVMSYEETMPWVQEIKEGIEKVLADTAETKYFYMDMKTKPEGWRKKAEEAFALYREYQPDGLIASDDDAQALFVLPYLKDKVKTPIMFCAVNADAEVYGYPADCISGILERHHFREMIAFAQQFDPSIKSFGYMIRESPVGKIIVKQIEREKDTYSAKFAGYRMPATLRDAESMAEDLKKCCDLLIVSTLTGVRDDRGNALSDKEAVPPVVRAFGKMVLGTEEQVVKAGTLCSVVRTGQEQGYEAAGKLLRALQGEPVSEIPVTRNQEGKRIINVTVMRDMGIKPNPEIVRGSQLVKTE